MCISGFVFAFRPKRLSICPQKVIAVIQHVLRKPYSLPSCGRSMRRRRRILGALLWDDWSLIIRLGKVTRFWFQAIFGEGGMGKEAYEAYDTMPCGISNGGVYRPLGMCGLIRRAISYLLSMGYDILQSFYYLVGWTFSSEARNGSPYLFCWRTMGAYR